MSYEFKLYLGWETHQFDSKVPVVLYINGRWFSFHESASSVSFEFSANIPETFVHVGVNLLFIVVHVEK